MRSYNSDKLKLIIALLIYGTIGVVRKNIPYPSSFIAFVRAAIGFLFLLCFRVVTRTWIDRAAVKRNPQNTSPLRCAARLQLAAALRGV